MVSDWFTILLLWVKVFPAMFTLQHHHFLSSRAALGEASDQGSRQKRKYCTSRRGEMAGIIPTLSSSGNERNKARYFLASGIAGAQDFRHLSGGRHSVRGEGEAALVSPARRDHEYNIDFKLQR